jgi:hypothetical protein
MEVYLLALAIEGLAIAVNSTSMSYGYKSINNHASKDSSKSDTPSSNHAVFVGGYTTTILRRPKTVVGELSVDRKVGQAEPLLARVLACLSALLSLRLTLHLRYCLGDLSDEKR